MTQYVPADQLWADFGGKLDFDYDHATYWPALRKLCEEKRSSRKQRWAANGSQVGEHEDYLAGGKETGLPPAVTPEQEQKKAAPVVAEAAPTATGTDDVTETLAKIELEGKPEDTPAEVQAAKTETA